MNVPPTKYDQPKGLLVKDEWPISLLPSTFIQFLTPPGKYPSYLPAKWQKPHGDGKEFSLLFAKHKFQDGKEVYLYRFPEAMDRSIGMESLEASIKTIGFLIIVDIELLLHVNRHVTDEGFTARKIIEEYGAIHWAKHYHLPIILAVLNSTYIENNLGKLSQLIDYSSDMPVVWCEGDIDYDFVQRVMDTIYTYV